MTSNGAGRATHQTAAAGRTRTTVTVSGATIRTAHGPVQPAMTSTAALYGSGVPPRVLLATDPSDNPSGRWSGPHPTCALNNSGVRPPAGLPVRSGSGVAGTATEATRGRSAGNSRPRIDVEVVHDATAPSERVEPLHGLDPVLARGDADCASAPRGPHAAVRGLDPATRQGLAAADVPGVARRPSSRPRGVRPV